MVQLEPLLAGIIQTREVIHSERNQSIRKNEMLNLGRKQKYISIFTAHFLFIERLFCNGIIIYNVLCCRSASMHLFLIIHEN